MAAITGDLDIPSVKPAAIRELVMGRVDAVLFNLSYEYVGDLAETISLIWPKQAGANRPPDEATGDDGPTRPAGARRVEPPGWLWPREPPIRTRAAIPTAWLEIVLREGRNRQVRRMTAAVGLPTLRLLRTAIGDWTLADLAPGAWRAETVHLPTQAAGRSAAARGTPSQTTPPAHPAASRTMPPPHGSPPAHRRRGSGWTRSSCRSG